MQANGICQWCTGRSSSSKGHITLKQFSLFFNEFCNYDVCNNHFELINDSPSKLPNNRIFREHRHDQAALSLIYKIYGVPYIPYKTGKGNHTNLAFIKETKIKK